METLVKGSNATVIRTGGGTKDRAAPGWRFGALSLLGICFATSALLRTGEVVAGLPESLTDGFGNPLPRAVAESTIPSETTIPETNALIAELQRQRAELSARQDAIDARAATLAAAERRIAARLDEMEAARVRLTKTAKLVDGAAARDVGHLAEMYQQMKPKQAAQIFDQMEPAFASGFLAEMRPDAAALILANMDATKAYAVTLLLAGRNVKSVGAD